MAYVTDVSALPDNRSRKLAEFVKRYSVKEVVFYDDTPLDAVVHHNVDWHSDKDGRYCIMTTDKGKFAFHRELSQVVAI